MSALLGRYKAQVVSVSLGVIGDHGSVAIEVGFKPEAELVGADWKEGNFPHVKKPYWLSDKVIDKGKSAGKTSIELTREQIKETYGYEGSLDEAELKTGLMGKKVELSCKPNPQNEKYTEVEYVNAPGGRKGFKKLKDVPADRMATLASLWSGKPKEEKHIDPKDLFNSMTQGGT